MKAPIIPIIVYVAKFVGWLIEKVFIGGNENGKTTQDDEKTE